MAERALRPNEEASTMTPETAWAEAMKFENRPNPYRFFDELRKTPVAHVGNGVYVVTGYRELHNASPRSPHQLRPTSPEGGSDGSQGGVEPDPVESYGRAGSMITADPPEHDQAAPSGDAAFRPSPLARPYSEF